MTDSGLVAWYPLDGNARDASGNGNHGAVRGLQPTTDRNGAPASALRFATPKDFVEFPPSSDFNFSDYRAVTLSIWMRPAPDMQHRGFSFGLGSGGTICRYFGISLGIEEMTAYGMAFASECIVKVECPLRSEGGPWHHMLATSDDRSLTLYIDGAFMSRRSVYDMKWEEPKMEKGLLAGYTSACPPKGIAVDDLRVYRRVLSAEEVMVLYTQGTNGGRIVR